jgi:hypothetical protein
MFRPRQPILVFGAGVGAARAEACLRHRCRVLAFVDNDPGKQGTQFQGRPVIGPQDLPRFGNAPIYVASMYADQIYRQLTVDLGIGPERVTIVRRQVLEGAYAVSPWTYAVLAVVILTLAAGLGGLGYLVVAAAR